MGFFCVKQKTAYEMPIRDWSSDVCSSDLARIAPVRPIPGLETDLLRAAARDFKHRLHRHARIDRIERIGFRHGGNARDGAAGRDEDDVERAWRVLHPEAGEQIGRASCRERVCQYV